MFKTVLIFALNAAVATAHPEWSGHVCGAYCGPGWCNGKYLEEDKCSGKHPVETHSLTGPSCADQCCRSHDMCCGHSKNRRPCNGDLENCLRRCDALSLSCTKQVLGQTVPVPAGAIWAAMELFSGDCCSGPCTSADNVALDEAQDSPANKSKTKPLFLPKTVSEYKTLIAKNQAAPREIDDGLALKPDLKRTSNSTNANNSLFGISGCKPRSVVVSRAISGAQGAYAKAVCGHLGPYRCDCSGLVSYAWGLPAPGAVTQTMQNYCNADVKWTGLKPGDAILHPSSHVLMFIRWNGPVGGDSFIQAACHDPQEGCSHGLGSISYYRKLGFFPCRAHPSIVCP